MNRSMYRQALEAMLHCPHCHAENIKGAKPTIEIQQGGETAECASCNCSGTLTVFLPKEPK